MAAQHTKQTLILTVLGGLCCPIADAATVDINECKYLGAYKAEDTEDSIEVDTHIIQIAGIAYDLRKRSDRGQLREDLSQCGLSESQMMTGPAWDRDPERAEAMAQTVVKDIHKRFKSDTSGFEQRRQDCKTELTPAACDRAIDHARIIEYPWGSDLRKAAAQIPQQASDRAWKMYTTAEQACNAGFSEQTGLSFDWTDRITICKSAISLAEQSRALTEHYPDTHKSETGRSSAELSAQITVIEERIATMHGRQSAAERAELAADQERRRIAEEQARQELAARQDQQRADEEQKRLADAAAVAAARRYETGAQLLGLAVKVVPSIENPYGYNLRGVTTCRIGLKKGSAPNDTEYSAYYAILYEVDIANAFGVSGRYFYPIEVIAPFKLSIPDVSYEFPKDLAAWFKTVGMRTSQKWILPGKVGILRGSMTGTSVTVVGDMSDSTQRYATRPSSTWCTDTLNWGVAFQTI